MSRDMTRRSFMAGLTAVVAAPSLVYIPGTENPPPKELIDFTLLSEQLRESHDEVVHAYWNAKHPHFRNS